MQETIYGTENLFAEPTAYDDDDQEMEEYHCRPVLDFTEMQIASLDDLYNLESTYYSAGSIMQTK